MREINAGGVKITANDAIGQTVVANGKNFYIVKAPEYYDELMEAVVEGTRVDNQAGRPINA